MHKRAQIKRYEGDKVDIYKRIQNNMYKRAQWPWLAAILLLTIACKKDNNNVTKLNYEDGVSTWPVIQKPLWLMVSKGRRNARSRAFISSYLPNYNPGIAAILLSKVTTGTLHLLIFIMHLCM